MNTDHDIRNELETLRREIWYLRTALQSIGNTIEGAGRGADGLKVLDAEWNQSLDGSDARKIIFWGNIDAVRSPFEFN